MVIMESVIVLFIVALAGVIAAGDVESINDTNLKNELDPDVGCSGLISINKIEVSESAKSKASDFLGVKDWMTSCSNQSNIPACHDPLKLIPTARNKKDWIKKHCSELRDYFKPHDKSSVGIAGRIYATVLEIEEAHSEGYSNYADSHFEKDKGKFDVHATDLRKFHEDWLTILLKKQKAEQICYDIYTFLIKLKASAIQNCEKGKIKTDTKK